MEIIIKAVEPLSISEELEIKKGDILLSINGKEIKDIIDYKLLSYNEELTLSIYRKEDNEIIDFEIEKYDDEPLGLTFESATIDEPRQCKNNCIFCFIAQMPKGLRKTLYFKDDDYRLSFLDGNYITLTNVSEKELDRIIDLSLSPINLSIHTTNEELRVKMTKNPLANKINYQLQKLKEAGIIINGQIVLCPTFNDDKELEKTLSDLLNYGGNLTSLSVVPVGLTAFREGLPSLRKFTKEEAINTINIIEKYQEKFINKYSKRILYPSAEFFIMAKKDIPHPCYYGDFIQYENGVGMLSLFLDEVNEAITKINFSKAKNSYFVLPTGELTYPYILEIANKIEEKFNNIKIEVRKIENITFGKSITVTGLITGESLLNEFKNYDFTNKTLLICENMLRKEKDLFLDDLSLDELKEKLNANIEITLNDGYDFINKIVKEQ